MYKYPQELEITTLREFTMVDYWVSIYIGHREAKHVCGESVNECGAKLSYI